MPSASTVPTTVINEKPFGCNAPSEHVNEPLLTVSVPCDVATESRLKFGGRKSLTTTFGATSGPRLLTVIE